MASARIVVRGMPTGLTLVAKLRPEADDDNASPTSIDLTENTNAKGTYRGATTAALTGLYVATILDSDGVFRGTFLVDMTDVAVDHRLVDASRADVREWLGEAPLALSAQRVQ